MANEERRDPRKPTALQIRFKSATIAEFVEKHANDISRGGMFIKMKSPFPTGTLIKFDARITEDAGIRGVGRVAWIRAESKGDAPAGMGIKFIKIDDRSVPVLEAVLAEKDIQSSKEGAFPFDNSHPDPEPDPPSQDLQVPVVSRAVEDATSADTAAEDASSLPEKQDDAFLAGSKDAFIADVDSALENALGDVSPKAEGKPVEKKPLAPAPAPTKSAAPSPPAAVMTKPREKGDAMTAVVIGLLLLGAALAGAWFFLRPPSTQEPSGEAVSSSPKIPSPPPVEKAAAEKTPAPVKEAAETTSISIKSSPDGAAVFLNGTRYSEKTPTVVSEQPVGERLEIEIRRFGFATSVQTLVPTENTPPVSVTLKPVPKQLEIESTPDNAAVFAGDKKIGRTPIKISPKTLNAAFELRIQKRGFWPLLRSISEADWTRTDSAYVLSVDAELEKKTRRRRSHLYTEPDSDARAASEFEVETEEAPEAAPEAESKALPEATTPEVKPEASPETKPAAESGAQSPAASEAESKAQSQAEAKPEASPAPEPKPEAKPEEKPDPKPEAKPEVKPEPKPEAKPEVKPEAKPEASPESEPKPEAKPEVKPEPKPETKSEDLSPKSKDSVEDNPF